MEFMSASVFFYITSFLKITMILDISYLLYKTYHDFQKSEIWKVSVLLAIITFISFFIIDLLFNAMM